MEEIAKSGGSLGEQMKALTERMVERSSQYDLEAKHRAEMNVQA